MQAWGTMQPWGGGRGSGPRGWGVEMGEGSFLEVADSYTPGLLLLQALDGGCCLSGAWGGATRGDPGAWSRPGLLDPILG